MKRILPALILLAVVAVPGILGARLFLFASQPAVSVPAGTEVPKTVIEIRRGQPSAEISRILAEKGVVSDARQFSWFGRLTGQWKKIKVGEYEVSPDMTPSRIFQVLASGVSIQRALTIREGENMYEVADALQEHGFMAREKFLALCRSRDFIKSLGFGDAPASLEGYLFPDTYNFTRALSPEDMVRMMVKRFSSEWGPAEDARARALGLSRHQAVTLASMIEKETGAQQERPLISSVFHNRLRKKMRLQSDPTTIYGMWERYKGNITRADLLAQNEYNTYAIPGLPVGPIGNPGREAIQAALHPSESTFLFFVSHNDGTHEFTSNLEAHNAAVRKFQMDPKAREGKSWRDLSKANAPKPRT